MSDMIAFNNNLPTAAADAEEKWGLVVNSENYLPRVQLCGPTSDLAKQRKVGIGNWALISSKDEFKDLGPDFNAVPVAYRFKAMRVVGESVFNYHDPKSPEYIDIKDTADAPNSGMSGCMYGPEFLIWLIGERKFGTIFFGSKTARREAPNLKALLKRCANIGSKYIEKATFSWYGPSIGPSSIPLSAEEGPQVEELEFEVGRFLNPKDSNVSTAPAAPADGRTR